MRVTENIHTSEDDKRCAPHISQQGPRRRNAIRFNRLYDHLVSAVCVDILAGSYGSMVMIAERIPFVLPGFSGFSRVCVCASSHIMYWSESHISIHCSQIKHWTGLLNAAFSGIVFFLLDLEELGVYPRILINTRRKSMNLEALTIEQKSINSFFYSARWHWTAKKTAKKTAKSISIKYRKMQCNGFELCIA